jgi:hypothetical protein
VLFPAFVAMAIVTRRPILHRVVVCLCATIAALLMVKYAAFSFVA